MLKNLDIVDEVTAEQIAKRNERRQTQQTRRIRGTRKAIEQYHEKQALARELREY